MRKFMCFTVPSSLFKSKKRNTTRKNSAKVLDVSIWPGEEASSRETLRDGLKLNIPAPTPSSTSHLSPDSQPSQPATSDQPATTAHEEEPTPSSAPEESLPLTEEPLVAEAESAPKLSYVQDWVQNLVEFSPEEMEELPPLEVEEEAPPVPPTKQPAPVTPAAANMQQSLISHSTSKINWIGLGLTKVPLLSSFRNLKQLSLSKNSIAKIPRGCLPRTLQSLDLSSNQITTLDGLRGLDRLRVLNLSDNRISRIGQALRDCVSLRELYLSNNKINVVEGLHRLRKLFLLDLSGNRLSTVNSLVQLTANHETLQVLNLVDNPLMENLSEERVRKLVMDIAPGIIYLNKQPVKAVPARELVVGKFSRTEATSGTRKSSPTPRSRARRMQSLQVQYKGSGSGSSNGSRTRRESRGSGKPI